MDGGRRYLSILYNTSYISYISLLCPLKELKSNNTSGVMSTPSSHILVSKYHTLLKGTMASWNLGWFQGRGQGKYKVSTFLCQKVRNSQNQMRACGKDIGHTLNGPSPAKCGTIWAAEWITEGLYYNMLN